MAYVDRSSNTRRTATAIAVATIQAGAIYAVVTGLAVTFVAPPPKDRPLEATDIRVTPIEPDKPKPAEPPIAPRPKTRDPVQRVTPVDNPIVEPPRTVLTGLESGGETGASGSGVAVIEPPKPPPPTFVPRLARPLNQPASWATPNDYPARDLREGNQGVTGFRLSIGADGKVMRCEVTSSSGFPGLDRAACDKITRRARFAPATDGYGTAVAGSYSSAIRWQIPD